MLILSLLNFTLFPNTEQTVFRKYPDRRMRFTETQSGQIARLVEAIWGSMGTAAYFN